MSNSSQALRRALEHSSFAVTAEHCRAIGIPRPRHLKAGYCCVGLAEVPPDFLPRSTYQLPTRFGAVQLVLTGVKLHRAVAAVRSFNSDQLRLGLLDRHHLWAMVIFRSRRWREPFLPQVEKGGGVL